MIRANTTKDHDVETGKNPSLLQRVYPVRCRDGGRCRPDTGCSTDARPEADAGSSPYRSAEPAADRRQGIPVDGLPHRSGTDRQQ